MSDTTAELALKLAIDNDDTADYLTIDLRNSLNVLDGVFSSATGHNHNGAHQGGNLVFGVLNTASIAFANGATLGPFATGNQLRFQSTNVSFSGGITVDGTATLTNLTVNGTFNSTLDLTVGRDLHVVRNSTLDGTLAVAGTTTLGVLNTTGRITSGTDMLITNGMLYFHPSGDTLIQRQGAGAVQMPNTVYFGGTNIYLQRAAPIGADPHPFILSNSGSGLWILNDGISFYTPVDPQGGGQSLRGISPSTRSAATYGGGEIHIALRLFVDGDITSGTNMHAVSYMTTSDPRLKSGMTVVPDDDCMTRVRAPNLPVYSYQITPAVGGSVPTPTATDLGFDANDVYQNSPEFVALDQDSQPVAVVYGQIVTVLWAALRQLDARCQAKGI